MIKREVEVAIKQAIENETTKSGRVKRLFGCLV